MDTASVVAKVQSAQAVLSALTMLNLVGYRWPKPACVKDQDTFDFIVVGGGTAGCLVVNRLIEIGNVSVLLIEAGGNPPLEAEVSGLFPLFKKTKYDWNFTSICDTHSTHKNNTMHMIQGKMIGGTGSLGYLGYQHGFEQDYNRWAELTNDTIWSWKSVSQVFSKNEQLIDKRILNSPSKCFYGTKGNIKVMRQYFKRNQEYYEAFKELDWDNPVDINPNTPLGFTDLMVNIGDDVRQSTALKFLSPIKKHPNLHVMLNTLASKIIFDHKKRAIGVEVITENKKTITVKANYEIIVSTGAIKSPQLLMLSGIGPKYHLLSKGIKSISDVPVGQNFQDHINSILVYKMTKAKRATQLEDPHKYPFAVFEGHVALNMSQKYPDYEVIGVNFGEPERFLQICAYYFNFDDKLCEEITKMVGNHEIFLVFITLVYPKSRGEIHLESVDANCHPIIIPNYYSNKQDVIDHANYIKDFHRVLDTSFFKKQEAQFILPNLRKCKGLKKGSDEFWRCYAVSMSDTAHYYVGTCGMGSVLDSKLRVRGVSCLRVIDASAFPDTVRTTTQATVMMLAQNAVDLIIKQYLYNL